jgi:hypothetical protein
MRVFVPTEPPKDFDPRLVKILREWSGYLGQVNAGFAAIQRGEKPISGGSLDSLAVADHHKLSNLNTYDDHPRYLQLAGRAGGQTAYGAPITGDGSSGAWTNGGNFTSKNSKVATATWSGIAIDTSAAVGDVIILALATLPFTTTFDAASANHSTLTDTKGNTWTKLKEYQYANTGNGACYSIWTCTVTTALSAGTDTLTAAFVASIGAMAISSHRYSGSGGSATIAGITVLGQEGFVGSEPSALTLSGLASGSQYLFLRFCAEGASGSNVVGPLSGSTNYTAFDNASSLTSGGTGNVGSFGEYRILAATTDTTDPSMGASGGDFVSIYLALALLPAPVGSLTLQATPLVSAAKITLSGSALTLYGRDIYFRDVGGATNLSSIRATTDGAFTGPLNYLGSATGGLSTDLVIPGRLLLGNNLSGVNFTAGRVLDIQALPTTNNLAAINILVSAAAIATVSGTLSGMQVALTGTPTAASGTGAMRGFFFTGSPTVPSGVTISSLYGGVFQTSPTNNGTLTKAGGLQLIALGGTTGNALGTLQGLEVGINTRGVGATTAQSIALVQATGTPIGAVTNYFGIDFGASAPLNSAVVVGWTGIRIPAVTLPTGTILGLDIAVAKNRLAGLHLGTGTADVHFLNIEAGTAAKAPIKLTSGVSLTTPVAGCLEFTTDDVFFTITTGAARKAFVLDDGARLTPGRIPFATTNGRLVDDADLTFAIDTLTVTKIAATQLTGDLTLADTINLILNTGTGSKIGTATSQKLGFWNTAPVVQPTTANAAATLVPNTSGIVDDTATFDGYTIGQVVKALRNMGLLA